MQTSDTKLIDALFTVIADHGWRGVTPGRLAALSGVPAGELVRRFPSRLDLLRLHADWVAAQVAEGTVPGQGGTPRDRVFDVLMRGVDALLPHRAGMLRLMSDMRRDGVLAGALAPILQRSMGRMLDAAELDSSGLQGGLRAAGLVGVWLMTLRAWEKDDSVDMGTTMAAVDRALDRAEQTARSLRLEPGDLAPQNTAD
ncbi:TetR family transcriptional regulator [Falsiroseomonas sp.]|uniref:TetR family transcriptional regulator n=1 Tax=Falsiroseomonas sp. TaxID=2870721 RepID=UPI0027363CC5|nr:TetR family transcriptional regulator [Falsiroseomonas sp.]MDP3416028.1 TetR family transcriptional regulator [Falsiroseomonas sp.]